MTILSSSPCLCHILQKMSPKWLSFCKKVRGVNKQCWSTGWRWVVCATCVYISSLQSPCQIYLKLMQFLPINIAIRLQTGGTEEEEPHLCRKRPLKWLMWYFYTAAEHSSSILGTSTEGSSQETENWGFYLLGVLLADTKPPLGIKSN